MRFIGNAIFRAFLAPVADYVESTEPFRGFNRHPERDLEESFSLSDGSKRDIPVTRADVFQCECKPKAAFDACSKIELTDFEAQAVAVRIIANLCCRPLEKCVLNVV